VVQSVKCRRIKKEAGRKHQKLHIDVISAGTPMDVGNCMDAEHRLGRGDPGQARHAKKGGTMQLRYLRPNEVCTVPEEAVTQARFSSQQRGKYAERQKIK
jgi:hypothetical protein